jgi:site-specific recombinase XerD
LIGVGAPIKVIQERLCHSSISTTLGIYAHVSKKLDRLSDQQPDEQLKYLHFGG